MSGLQAALARIGAIERLVAGARTPALPPAAAAAATFADALDRAAAAASTDAPPAGPDVAPTAASAARSIAPTALAGLPTTFARSIADRQVTAAPVVADGVRSDAVPSGYRPSHVTQTDERVWNDCTWASAAMWIDRLTGGSVKVDREALRAASGDTAGGSSLRDVVRGARKLLGMDLRDAHGEGLTLEGLLDRLASGGGAIVQGSYASLPAHLTRHDPGFAAKGVAASGHAVYVGPLDRETGKVWWDDPLAPAGGSGEWVSVKDLKRFAWTDAQGRVYAMATPAGDTGSTAPARAGTVPGSATASAPAADGTDAASIAAAAWTAGVDPLLLTAYLHVARVPSDAGTVADSAADLAAALARYGRADLALENLGSARRSGGSAFAVRVLRQWAGLLDGGTGA